MDSTVLLVDYENVGKIDLSSIPPGVTVPFFFGASQKSVPTEFLKAALKLGDRFVPIDIAGHGRNALDFHIAFYLGEYLTKSPAIQCVILSKDKGFDPLVKHLAERGLRVKRAADVAQAFPAAAPRKVTPPAAQPAEIFKEALACLAKMPKKNRPSKRKKLIAHLLNYFSKKKIPEEEMQRVIEQMISDQKLTLTGETVSYHL